MTDHKQGACIKMNHELRDINNTAKVSIYCCGTSMDNRGDWPHGEVREDQAMVVTSFCCLKCRNNVKLVQPWKQYQVTNVKVNGISEYTEGTMVDI